MRKTELNNEFSETTKNHRQNYLKRFQELKEKEKEEKLRRLMLKDEYLEERKRSKIEENRLRSVIQVGNKFRLSGNTVKAFVVTPHEICEILVIYFFEMIFIAQFIN